MINILFGLFLLFLAFRLYLIRRVDGENIWLAGFCGYMAMIDILGLSLTGRNAGTWLLVLGYVFKVCFALCCAVKIIKTKKDSRDQTPTSSDIKVERLESQSPEHVSKAG